MTGSREVQAISFPALARALSEPRLETYRLHADEPIEIALGRYRWNIALSTSLYPALGFLEIALRNNLHRSITELCRSSSWYDVKPAVLTEREQRAVILAKDELRRRGKPDESDRVVAELNFGFWTSLLSSEYERVLWQKILMSAFPLMPSRHRARPKIAARLHGLRRLRNRVSHHEPIHNLTNLVKMHDDLLAEISWLAPSVLRLLPLGETFDNIYKRGPGAYEVLLSNNRIL